MWFTWTVFLNRNSDHQERNSIFLCRHAFEVSCREKQSYKSVCTYFLRAIWWCPGGLCDSSAPAGAAVAVWGLVPRQLKSQGSREAADPGWRLPGARVWDHAWTVRPHGTAGGSAQTPASSRPRRSGELGWEMENMRAREYKSMDGWRTFFKYYFLIIILFFLSFRFVQKTIGLKAWVTWSATTWTTDSPSYQLVAKCVCNSQWSAGPDITHTNELTPPNTRALLQQSNTRQTYAIYTHDNTTLDTHTQEYIMHTPSQKESQKRKKESAVSLQNLAHLLLLPPSPFWTPNCDLQSSTPPTIRCICPQWRSTAAISQ